MKQKTNSPSERVENSSKLRDSGVQRKRKLGMWWLQKKAKQVLAANAVIIIPNSSKKVGLDCP